jgi:hypothetical protein
VYLDQRLFGLYSALTLPIFSVVIKENGYASQYCKYKQSGHRDQPNAALRNCIDVCNGNFYNAFKGGGRKGG